MAYIMNLHCAVSYNAIAEYLARVFSALSKCSRKITSITAMMYVPTLTHSRLEGSNMI